MSAKLRDSRYAPAPAALILLACSGLCQPGPEPESAATERPDLPRGVESASSTAEKSKAESASGERGELDAGVESARDASTAGAADRRCDTVHTFEGPLVSAKTSGDVAVLTCVEYRGSPDADEIAGGMVVRDYTTVIRWRDEARPREHELKGWELGWEWGTRWTPREFATFPLGDTGRLGMVLLLHEDPLDGVRAQKLYVLHFDDNRELSAWSHSADALDVQVQGDRVRVRASTYERVPSSYDPEFDGRDPGPSLGDVVEEYELELRYEDGALREAR